MHCSFIAHPSELCYYVNIQKYKHTEILGKKTEDRKKLILQADDIQKDCGKKSDLIKMVDHFLQWKRESSQTLQTFSFRENHSVQQYSHH